MSAKIASGEEMEAFARRYLSAGRPLLDDAFLHFASLNGVINLEQAARGVAALLTSGSLAMLVSCGTCSL
jgi:hypothetical protein